MIIGLTGTYCAGKDTVAELLVEMGFVHYSLSDAIRDEARAKGLPLTRDNLIALGNQLRTMHGPAILSERLLEKVGKENYVLSSIRHPAEVGALMIREDFFLVAVDAPIKIRLKRIKLRGRESDPQTLKDLKEYEESESKTSGPGQQLSTVRKMASYVVNNAGTESQLKKKIKTLLFDLQKIVDKIPKKYERPVWDDYFLTLAREVGKRGTCDRGRSGAIAVKDKRILCTGYAGSPVGLPHCDEVGHQIKKTVHEDGKISSHCVRTTHSEQNVICQAARFGIALDGATIYTKFEPCFICAKMIINAGINRVVCEKRYHAAVDSRRILQQAGVKLTVVNDELEEYENQ